MICFLACFGSSKDAKRKKQRRKVLHRNQRYTSSKPEQPGVSSVEDYSKTVLSPASALEVQEKPEEQFSFSKIKKVTFDSNVETYEPVLPDEVTDFPPEKSGEGRKKEDTLAKSSHSKSSSEDSLLISTGSDPPNHRYQNCRDSDGEDEDLDYGGSDLSDEDDEDDDSDKGEEYDGEFGEDFEEGIAISREKIAAAQLVAEEVESPIRACDNEVKSIGSNPNARDRSIYVRSVLNPVENLTQWKAVKAKRKSALRPQKENSISFSREPSSKEIDQSKKLNQEIPVNASLSNWLVSSETIPVNEASPVVSYSGIPGRSTSPGSNSVLSHEDRPILGALTVNELQHFSASCSPRKSPSQSPDEMPIIGTVGTYWNHTVSTEDAGTVSSFKGIPNTTSKYREDKRVNWHTTPFETRLERALNGGAAEAAFSCS